MIGSGALIECVGHPDVEEVLVVGRRSCGVEHERVSEVLHSDFSDLSPLRDRLTGYDACLFCLGVSSAGMSEADYTRITYDITLAVAEVMLDVNPESCFVYISGAGSDSSESGRVMWARVKGRIENQLASMTFGGGVYNLRPAFIQPMKGVRSATRLYNVLYAVLGPFYPLLKRLRGSVTTTEKLGLALIACARDGAASTIVENDAINLLAEDEGKYLGRTLA